MSNDLVKRLRGALAEAARARFEAADRIEQLERELAAHRLATKHANDHADAAISDLAAEKALADDMYNAWKSGVSAPPTLSVADYRKARGL